MCIRDRYQQYQPSQFGDSHYHNQHRRQLFNTPSNYGGGGHSGSRNDYQRQMAQKQYYSDKLLQSRAATFKTNSQEKVSMFRQGISQSLEKTQLETFTPIKKSEEEASSTKKKRVSCNCKKSRCLKLYCDCFKEGLLCKDCNCIGCANNEENIEERNHALHSIIAKSPEYKPGITAPVIIDEDRNTARHRKGCNCKKSGCVKKYCECYQLGVKCTDLCKCEECRNCDSSACMSEEEQNGHHFSKAIPFIKKKATYEYLNSCLLYTSPSPRDRQKSRMPSSA
eukprot:TRINITY_DN5220_c0_g1_i1.p2 TRINITY_DN5220_c0_g1~~TRINITY_DN5220_c0_g1_i1.p2  ORF type:complete len:281 (-),score=44.49 TRINITY_DN5220_c0_g1_i1:2-844(-)